MPAGRGAALRLAVAQSAARQPNRRSLAHRERGCCLNLSRASQAIDTLVYYADRDPQALALATKVARWTIEHMQDRSGYFYYRRYPNGFVNKTATLHWGQATMFHALALLLLSLDAQRRRQ